MNFLFGGGSNVNFKEDEMHVNRTLTKAGDWTTLSPGRFEHRHKKNISYLGNQVTMQQN